MGVSSVAGFAPHLPGVPDHYLERSVFDMEVILFEYPRVTGQPDLESLKQVVEASIEPNKLYVAPIDMRVHMLASVCRTLGKTLYVMYDPFHVDRVCNKFGLMTGTDDMQELYAQYRDNAYFMMQ